MAPFPTAHSKKYFFTLSIPILSRLLASPDQQLLQVSFLPLPLGFLGILTSAFHYHLQMTTSGVSWGCIACACTPGGVRGAKKKEARKGREKRERKGAPKKERREGKENMQKKRKSGKKLIKRKKDLKRKTHWWRPVSDNRKRLKEKEPMKKQT